MKFRLSNHAKKEIQRRRIPISFVESVLNSPQQIVEEKGGKKAYTVSGRRVFKRVVIPACIQRESSS